MRDAVPPCGTTGGGGGVGTAPAAARTADPARARLPQRIRRRLDLEVEVAAGGATPPTHPETTRAGHHGRPPRPTALNGPPASHPGDALGRLRNNPSDEEDPPEQTTTTTLTPHILKTTPE